MEQLVARWAHNPKVIRSSRISATKEKEESQKCDSSFFVASSLQPTAAHVYSQTAQFENLGELVKMVIFAA